MVLLFKVSARELRRWCPCPMPQANFRSEMGVAATPLSFPIFNIQVDLHHRHRSIQVIHVDTCFTLTLIILDSSIHFLSVGLCICCLNCPFYIIFTGIPSCSDPEHEFCCDDIWGFCNILHLYIKTTFCSLDLCLDCALTLLNHLILCNLRLLSWHDRFKLSLCWDDYNMERINVHSLSNLWRLKKKLK